MSRAAFAHPITLTVTLTPCLCGSGGVEIEIESPHNGSKRSEHLEGAQASHLFAEINKLGSTAIKMCDEAAVTNRKAEAEIKQKMLDTVDMLRGGQAACAHTPPTGPQN